MADLDKESLQYLTDLRQVPTVTVIDGRTYVIHPTAGEGESKVDAMPEPVDDTLQVSTLQGLRDLIASNFESHAYETSSLLHVVSHEQVNLILKVSDLWGRRLVIASAKLPKVDGFKFATYMDHESFTVALLSQFVETEDRAYLLRISANIGDEAVKNSSDDGISQMVSVRKGVTLKGTEVLRNRVKLAPYRTFREIDQPASDFIFRVRRPDREGGIPELALFEADGGAWKLEATDLIIRNFHDKTTVPIVS